MVKKIGILVALAAIAGFLVWKFYINKPVENVSNIKPAFSTIDYKALVTEINASDSVANAKYMDKVIAVKGIIKAMQLGDSASSVTIGEPENDIEIVCQIDVRNNTTAKNLKDGDSTVIKGKVTGIDNQRNPEDPEMGLGISFQMKDCTVENKK
jgi:hypothetical protein